MTGPESVRARACAKAILLGEHAVVHGVPAIAVPVAARGTEVEVVPGEGDGVSVEDARGIDTALAAEMARLALRTGRVISEECRKEGKQEFLPSSVPAFLRGDAGLRVTISSTIPVGSGLGSSAALAVALVRAVHGDGLAPDEVARGANELEAISHGTPSGIDAAAIAHARPIVFRKDAPPEPLALAAPVRLAVGVLPRTGTTASLVAEVHRLKAERPDRFGMVVRGIRDAVEDALRALRAGDLERLAGAMEMNQGLLREMGVSRPEVARACDAACEAGALGAKLSGAGGGGAVIALLGSGADPDRVLAAFRASGATEAFLTEVPAA